MSEMDEKPLLIKLAEQNQLQQLLGFVRAEVEDEGGSSGTGRIKPTESEFLTGLRNETREMEIQQRKLEQSGHRQFAKVNAREKNPNEPERGHDLDHGNGMKEHPILNSQRFDGVDNNLNPSPPNNPDALWLYENEKEEQEKAKELRLGLELSKRNEYQPSSAPTPRPGR